VYELVRKNTSVPEHFFSDSHDYTEVCKIKSTILTTTEDIHLYRRKSKKLGINDDGATFAKLNVFLKNKKFINSTQYKSIEWVRKERNKLHIQGLSDHDTNYTEAKVNRTAKIIYFLMKKV
jgi:serine phosphatase RsbU (regulator of sigma subunit)